MSTIETILSRAMNDSAFADALFADPEKTLAEYKLPADVMAQLKNLSRAKFEAWAAENRRSTSGPRFKGDDILLQINGMALPNISWNKIQKNP